MEGLSDKEICLSLSDDLWANEEELNEDYKDKIATFINNSHQWFENLKPSVLKWAKEIYKIENPKVEEWFVLHIYILFEQADEEEIYGVMLGVDFDDEHNCGVKINGKTLRIIETGTGDVAFC